MQGKVSVYFDGGCRPNPGAMEIAVVVRGRAEIRRDIGHGDNSDAEWLALLHAARIASASRIEDVEFVGDARHVIRQARGDWPCRDARLMQHLTSYRAAIGGFARVRLRYVARSKNLAGIALARTHER